MAPLNVGPQGSQDLTRPRSQSRLRFYIPSSNSATRTTEPQRQRSWGSPAQRSGHGGWCQGAACWSHNASYFQGLEAISVVQDSRFPNRSLESRPGPSHHRPRPVGSLRGHVCSPAAQLGQTPKLSHRLLAF